MFSFGNQLNVDDAMDQPAISATANREGFGLRGGSLCLFVVVCCQQIQLVLPWCSNYLLEEFVRVRYDMVIVVV